MTSKLEQETEWQLLHDCISDVLDVYGTRNAFREGDYWLLDENWGWCTQQVEVQNLNLLRPEIVAQLQAILAAHSNWQITVRVDVLGTEDRWPGMGLIIRSNEVVDELQREFLPQEYREFKYDRTVS